MSVCGVDARDKSTHNVQITVHLAITGLALTCYESASSTRPSHKHERINSTEKAATNKTLKVQQTLLLFFIGRAKGYVGVWVE